LVRLVSHSLAVLPPILRPAPGDMGSCVSSGKQTTSVESADPPIITPADTIWDVENMKKGLDGMEQRIAAAASDALLPPKPRPGPLGPAVAAQLNEWTFDIFSVPYEKLPEYVYHALVMHPAISDKSTNLDLDKLWRFVREIATRYHPRPFHNFRHAVDVVLATSSLIRIIQRDKPRPFEDATSVAALLISALVHDTDHPGVMNPYLVNVKHPIATKLGDAPKAVLEHHHAAMALALLERPELNFLSALSSEKQQSFAASIKKHVLDTDVTTTMGAAKDLKALAEHRRPSATTEKFTEDVRNSVKDGFGGPSPDQVMCVIIKAADISNPARPLGVYSKWIDGVMTEFFTQGDAEKAAGLPVSMNCDRTKVQIPASQVGFIKFLVKPLYEALGSYSPAMKPVLAQLESNLAHFAEQQPPAQ